jgi:hypothetical protein
MRPRIYERTLKPCLVCGDPVPWVAKDYPKRYALKKYCSNKCEGQALRGIGDARRAANAEHTRHLKRERDRRMRANRLEFFRQKNRAYAAANKERYEEARRNKYALDPSPFRARSAVSAAVMRGNLPNISSLECARCHRQAVQYHHPSYHPNDRLNVIPLCGSCHALTHTRPEVAAEVERGHVLTSIGMIRIPVA